MNLLLKSTPAKATRLWAKISQYFIRAPRQLAVKRKTQSINNPTPYVMAFSPISD